jgi:hypothetical protein
MTIALITNGMLQNCCIIGGLRAPDDTQALLGVAPTVPCNAFAEDPNQTAPIVPVQTKAYGPAIPSTPCGSTGYDPTINPPKVPEGTEASEELGTESPAIPKCPEGHNT